MVDWGKLTSTTCYQDGKARNGNPKKRAFHHAHELSIGIEPSMCFKPPEQLDVIVDAIGLHCHVVMQAAGEEPVQQQKNLMKISGCIYAECSSNRHTTPDYNEAKRMARWIANKAVDTDLAR
ncbi:hypothetical protein EJB05_12885 [Eragrostis curvula]|uniref:Uncharacterized protein n=1 Tax=Eragrostis curvula TaxID=38414 RepID=A0A5J9VV51_9POAL|nr:hypothetical protein EJB05_12885 [Eragrostis curvula]